MMEVPELQSLPAKCNHNIDYKVVTAGDNADGRVVREHRGM
jgi:hypothetical protein